MKILKFILFLVLILLAVGLIASMLGPKDYNVKRSMIINANDSITFNYISKFENWGGWSPWAEKDPNMKTKVEGEDGTVGARNSWEGDPESSGTGSMTFTEVVPNSKVVYDLQFTVPREMHSTGGFNLESSGNNTTKVTWYDKGEIPFMQRAVILLFVDLENEIGPSFERGLIKIDSLATIDQNILSTAPAE